MTDKPILQHPAPRPAWLALRSEPIIDPELPIIDPHHHLWDRNGGYLLDDLLADLGTGHNIVSTVFLQCAYAHRTDGPEAMRPVGETEFVAGVADEAARRGGKTRVCEGIVGHADLQLGDAVAPVLEAHIAAAGGRFRGIRHITARSEFFMASILPPPPTGIMAAPTFRAGFAQMHGYGLSYDAWLYHTQIDELTALAQAFPDTQIVLNHVGGPRAVCRQARRGVRGMACLDAAACGVPERDGEARRPGDADCRVRFPRARVTTDLGRSGNRLAAVARNQRRIVRRRSLHVREQFPGGQGDV